MLLVDSALILCIYISPCVLTAGRQDSNNCKERCQAFSSPSELTKGKSFSEQSQDVFYPIVYVAFIINLQNVLKLW